MLKTITAACLTLVASLGVATAKDITVAAMTGNIPYEFEDASGQMTGFELDVMNAVAKTMGIKVAYTPMPFNSLFAAVQSGRADAAIGSIAVTPKRLESVSFTQPFFDINQCLGTRANSPVAGVKDLKGKTLAVVTGSTGEIWATKNQQQYGYTDIKRYDAPNDAMLDIATGRLEAFLNDCPNIAYYIKGKPQYKIAETVETKERLGIMTSKDNPNLKNIDGALSKLKQEGEIAKLYQKWFNAPADQGSATVTVLPIPTL